MIVVAFGWFLLALPAALFKHMRRLHPARGFKLILGSLTVGFGLVSVGLLAMAAPTLLEGIGAHHLAVLCRRLLHDTFSGGHLGGFIAVVVLVGLVLKTVVTVLRLKRARKSARIERWVGLHQTSADHDLVIVPMTEPLAVTEGGGSGQIIVSSGLIALLSEEELSMVVHHELIHVNRRHHRYLTLAAVIEATLGWVPFVRASVHVLRLGVERWADEEAAGPDLKARQTLRSALLAASRDRSEPSFAGFWGIDLLAERFHALNTKPVALTPRWLHMSAAALASTATAAWLGSMAVIGVSLASGSLCFV